MLARSDKQTVFCRCRFQATLRHRWSRHIRLVPAENPFTWGEILVKVTLNLTGWLIEITHLLMVSFQNCCYRV